jgi:Ser/Thr protein kinase RdoA (MazF antagonist)
MENAPFDLLSPDLVAEAVETGFGFIPAGQWTVYPSYINRVFGFSLSDGSSLVAKFYRPGRWSREALEDEHVFMEDCIRSGVAVAAPIIAPGGETFVEMEVDSRDGRETTSFFFSLYERIRSRNFDPETATDWRRLGNLVGLCHFAGRRRDAPARPFLHPRTVTAACVDELEYSDSVHPTVRAAFLGLCRSVIDRIAPLFEGMGTQRIHGDCHRGNLFSEKDGSLRLIDFDDCMMGVPVQDLWLNLPGPVHQCGSEIEAFVDGYERVMPFQAESLRLVEGLRFMRMVYHLAWTARQVADRAFFVNNPEWETEGFWFARFADLREQVSIMDESPF